MFNHFLNLIFFFCNKNSFCFILFLQPKEKDCETNNTRIVCAVGYPFLKTDKTVRFASAIKLALLYFILFTLFFISIQQESFQIQFEPNPSHIRKDIVINVTATT